MAIKSMTKFPFNYSLLSGEKFNRIFGIATGGTIGTPVDQVPGMNIATLTVAALTNTGTGTNTGTQTFTVGPIFTPNAPVAATGSVLATAAQLKNGFTLVTASDGTKAVKLPAIPTPGMLVTLFNSVAAQPLIIFPDAAATINAIASHGALTCANGVPVMLYATSATQWYSLPLLPS